VEVRRIPGGGVTPLSDVDEAETVVGEKGGGDGDIR
jgi:hypothetical protein